MRRQGNKGAEEQVNASVVGLPDRAPIPIQIDDQTENDFAEFLPFPENCCLLDWRALPAWRIVRQC